MKKHNFIKQAAYCLISFIVLTFSAKAQIPVIDVSSVKNSITSWFEISKGNKYIASTNNIISKTNSAIGEGKSTISEYVVENKRRIEEKKEKVEQYKKETEEYKKEYQEYQKQYEETKEQVEYLSENQNDGLIIKGQGNYFHQEKVAYAFALKLEDNGTDVNGNFIIPQSIAMYCNLNSQTAQEEGKVDLCLRNLNQNSQKSRTEDHTDAPEFMKMAKAEYAASVIAEAYKAKNDAESFEEKILDPIEDAPAPQVLDIYSNVIEVNKAVVNTLNSILRIQSARLALKSFDNYGKYNFLPEEG